MISRVGCVIGARYFNSIRIAMDQKEVKEGCRESLEEGISIGRKRPTLT